MKSKEDDFKFDDVKDSIQKNKESDMKGNFQLSKLFLIKNSFETSKLVVNSINATEASSNALILLPFTNLSKILCMKETSNQKKNVRRISDFIKARDLQE
ncbi:recQ-mediated genome instability protein 1-like isoform X2 [Vespula squamosa]|uniref:RecQ-mediated genome instability protein 1-like isoform X2 n=1 Tax=Vespula squamosa TaxID=30214 RepID=A0ABD1ZXY5_VESSQ